MLTRGFPLEGESEQSFHFGNKSYFLLFLFPYLIYILYISTNLGISVSHEPFLVMLEIIPQPVSMRLKERKEKSNSPASNVWEIILLTFVLI